MSSTLGQLPDETKIARYMSFDKFFCLMRFGSAFFPSIKTLRSASGNQGDELEGIWSFYDMVIRNGHARKLDEAMSRWPAFGEANHEKEKIEIDSQLIKTPFGEIPEDGYGVAIEKMAAWVDVWCWNRFSGETVDMWRAYASQPGSVMITSTVGDLRASLSIPAGSLLFIEDVVYQTRNKANPDVKDEYTVFLQKSIAYENEKEIRALVLDPKNDFREETQRVGTEVGVNIRQLVKEVVPHYQSPSWMVKAIDDVATTFAGISTSKSSILQEIERVSNFKSWMS